MIMSSRLTFGMAEQRLLPSVLTRLLPNRGTPWVAIAVTTLASMGLAVMGHLQALAETVVLLLLLGVFISTNVAVLALRKDKAAHPHCQVWLFGLGFLAVGLVLHLLAQWAARREAAPSNYSAAA